MGGDVGVCFDFVWTISTNSVKDFIIFSITCEMEEMEDGKHVC